MFFSRAILAAENKRSFYVTARVKKEGVQALSLRLHKSTVKNVQGKYIFWQYCITGKFTLSLFSRFSDYIPLFRCFFSQLKSLSLWEKCGSIKTVHPCTVLMPEFCKQNSVLFCLPLPPEAVVFTAFKNPHRLYEKTSCFAVIFSRFFFSADALKRCLKDFLRKNPQGLLTLAKK